MKRILFLVVAAFVIGAAVVAPSAAKEKGQKEKRQKERGLPGVIQLPVGFQSEGIEAGRGHTFFVGSTSMGAVFRGSFVTGTGSVLFPAQAGRAAIGIEFDQRGDRLFVAGGPTGKAFVYDASSGEDVATFDLTTSSTFINDVVLTREAAWFTDSVNQVLYRNRSRRKARWELPRPSR